MSQGVIAAVLPSWWRRLFMSRRRLAADLNTTLICADHRVLRYDQFAVIYDVDGADEYFGEFSSPLEAELMFASLHAGYPAGRIHNARLVLILEPMP